jgi:SRSO17 transposase
VLDDTAVPRLKRLMHWLEPFAECFGHAAQLVSFGSYVSGLFSDSPRKSMEAMLARVTEAPRYQAFQHFITHAPWEAERVWRTLLAVGAALYLPQAWLDDPARRAKVRIPPPTRFQEKWPRRSLARLVDLVHRRWAIEQQYAETKTELGLDHFEGRSYPGWNHHVVITAVAYAFLQQERGDGTARLTFPQIRAIVQEIFTGLFFAAHPRYLDWIQRARELLPLRLI